MKLLKAIGVCHVRSAIFRASNPKIKYWKNNSQTILERVPVTDRDADDWKEYDPRDDDEGSLFMFND